MTQGLVNSMATGPTERFPQLVKVRLCFRLSPGEPFEAWGLEPVSRKSRKGKSRNLFGPEKPFIKFRLAYSVKLVFSYVVKEIKM